MAELRDLSHPFLPVIDSNCTILVLGSFPSVISQRDGYYYANPTNRFYRVLSELYHEDFVTPNFEGKRALLLKHHIALYDAIESCKIVGSSDALISEVVPLDLKRLLKQAPIQTIFCNGKKAYDEVIRYNPSYIERIIKLPSTSAANATMRLPQLIQEWKVLIQLNLMEE